MYKGVKGLSTVPFDRFFTVTSVNNTRGHSAKIVKQDDDTYVNSSARES